MIYANCVKWTSQDIIEIFTQMSLGNSERLPPSKHFKDEFLKFSFCSFKMKPKLSVDVNRQMKLKQTNEKNFQIKLGTLDKITIS